MISCEKVCRRLRAQDTTLTHLNFTYNKIGVEGARAIGEALEENSTLTWLDLEANGIGVEGAQAVAEALLTNTTLTHLDLRSNRLGDEGARAIAEALKENTTLIKLYLCNIHIGFEGAKAIGEILKENSTLTVLDLRDDYGIGVRGVRHLEAVLQDNHSLLTLRGVYSRSIDSLLERNKRARESGSEGVAEGGGVRF